MRYLNSQEYYECQLITVINAAMYLGEPGIQQYSVEYERWVDFLKGARDEGVWNIRPALRYLGLDFIRVPLTPESIMCSLDKGCPIELAFHSRLGNIHSALAIDYNHEQLRIPNHGFHKSEWIDWKFMLKRIANGPKIAKQKGIDCKEYKKGFKSFYTKDPYDVVFEMEE